MQIGEQHEPEIHQTHRLPVEEEGVPFMTRKSMLKIPAIIAVLAMVALAGMVALSTQPSSAAPSGAMAIQINSNRPADGTEPLPTGASIETVLPGLTGGPVSMAFDPSGRLFFTEKYTGYVRMYANGVLQAAPVITYDVDSCSERGLLGIAIDPNFNSNHYIYVYYTANPGSACGSTTNRVARFVENSGVGSGSVDIFTSPQTAGNHNGGNIHFGPDGKLYITIGDNANAANAQDVTVKNGKIHRLNPDGSIPSDNPVFTQTGALPSLYVMGVRNSFDFVVDPLTASSPYPRIFASENGPSCDDEMNRIEAGYNYGWRASYPCDDPSPSPVYNTIPPLWYVPNGQCCVAPTGIEVYTGTQIPQWTNELFMAAANTGQLRHFYLNAQRTLVTQTNVVQGVTTEDDLQTGPDGALWYIEHSPYSSSTDLKRIVGSGGATATPSSTNTPAPPTNTRTNTPPPTNTPTHTNTPTITPTPTNSNTPLPTQTPGGPTATPEPSNTSTATATDTASPTEVVPTGTDTPAPPTSTDTPVPLPPTHTDTPVPSTPTLLPTQTACTIQFTDVPPESTFYPYIQCLACQGIINGYECGGPGEPCDDNHDPYFRPGNLVSRGQIAKIVANAANFDDFVSPDAQTYEDVPPDSTFWVYIERLTLYQVMQGYPCGGPGEPCNSDNDPYFRPSSNATRGQIAKIVSNAAGFDDDIQTGTQTFEDVQEGSTFHIFVERLLLNRPDVMQGYPCGGPGEPCVEPNNRPYFRPAANATRGQLSKIVSNTFYPGCVLPVKVMISEFSYHPDAITIAPGTTVRFINRDLDYHTATVDDGSFDTGRIYQNQFVDVYFDRVGSYAYHCIPHPYMQGTINVVEPDDK